MTLSGRWARRLSPKEDQPSPSSPVSNGTWARIKSRISLRRRQEATEPEISRGTTVPTNNPCHEPSHREHGLLSRISSPRPLVTPQRRPTMWSPPQDSSPLPPTHMEDSSSSRSALHDSPVSECDYSCSAVPRADALGAIDSTECYVSPYDAEANAGEAVKAVSLQHFPSSPSPHPIKSIERSEQSPSLEPDSPWTPESLYALSRLESDEVKACLNEAGIVKARRRHLRVQTLRASFEPANQELPPEMNALGLTTSPEHDGLTVDRDSVESAGQEVASSAAAPVATTPLHSTPYEWIINAITPCIQSAAEASLGTEWTESAGDNESESSLPAAPTPPTTVLRFEPCNIVIIVTPPSPPPTPRHSLNHIYTTSLGMNPDNSHPVSHHPDLANAISEGDNPCIVLQQPVILATPPPVKNYSRPFRPDTDQGVGSVAYMRPSNRTDSELFMSPIEGQTEAQNARFKSEALSRSSHFEPSGETEDQLSFFDMLALGGSIDSADYTVDRVKDASAVDEADRSVNVEPIPPLSLRKPALHISSPFEPSGEGEEQLSFFDMLALGGTIDNADQTVDGVDDASAVDEAEPSFNVEPVPTLLSRRSATVNRPTEESKPRPVQYRVRGLSSRVTSSLRKWGKAMSRPFVRRPEKNTPSDPSFNPRQGFVPPREPSPDCIAFSDALALLSPTSETFP